MSVSGGLVIQQQRRSARPARLALAVLVVLIALAPLVWTGIGLYRALFVSPFAYTGRELEQFPEMQLVPPGARRLGAHLWDGGQGIAGRSIAYASVAYGTDLTGPELGMYFDRELLARGWERCRVYPRVYPTSSANPTGLEWRDIGIWCKGNLQYRYGLSPQWINANHYAGQYPTIYEVRLTEMAR